MQTVRGYAFSTIIFAGMIACSTGTTTSTSSSQGQSQLADASSSSGSAVGPGLTPVELMARQQADEAGTCRAPTVFPELAEGGLPVVPYTTDDGGVELVPGCAQAVPEILCITTWDAGEVCGSTCGPDTYTLRCGISPDPSLGCTVVKTPGPPGANYCCPCPP
jgi:hypothetical protein